MPFWKHLFYSCWGWDQHSSLKAAFRVEGGSLDSHGLKGTEHLWGGTSPLSVPLCFPSAWHSIQITALCGTEYWAILTNWRGGGAGGNIIG